MSVIAIPAWLLRTFGSGPAIDALLGDLHEEYLQGRSAAWFWRQALTGVAVTFVADVGAHRLITLRSIALAWGLKVAAVAVAISVKPWTAGALASGGNHTITVSGYRMVDGVAMPRVLEIPRSFVVYDPLILLFLMVAAAWITGWAVTRLHRPSSTSSLLAIAITFLAIGAWPVFSLHSPAEGPLIIENAWLDVLKAASMVVPAVALIAGGLRSARHEDRRAQI